MFVHVVTARRAGAVVGVGGGAGGVDNQSLRMQHRQGVQTRRLSGPYRSACGSRTLDALVGQRVSGPWSAPNSSTLGYPAAANASAAAWDTPDSEVGESVTPSHTINRSGRTRQCPPAHRWIESASFAAVSGQRTSRLRTSRSVRYQYRPGRTVPALIAHSPPSATIYEFTDPCQDYFRTGSHSSVSLG